MSGPCLSVGYRSDSYGLPELLDLRESAAHLVAHDVDYVEARDQVLLVDEGFDLLPSIPGGLPRFSR